MAGDLLHDWDGALPNKRDRHRVGAHAVARDAAGGVGRAQESRDVTLLADLDAFFQEHRRCGDLDSAVEGDRV